MGKSSPSTPALPKPGLEATTPANDDSSIMEDVGEALESFSESLEQEDPFGEADVKKDDPASNTTTTEQEGRTIQTIKTSQQSCQPHSTSADSLTFSKGKTGCLQETNTRQHGCDTDTFNTKLEEQDEDKEDTSCSNGHSNGHDDLSNGHDELSNGHDDERSNGHEEKGGVPAITSQLINKLVRLYVVCMSVCF